MPSYNNFNEIYTRLLLALIKKNNENFLYTYQLKVCIYITSSLRTKTKKSLIGYKLYIKTRFLLFCVLESYFL